jgi:cytochrome b subunit of formate dehydrogenase
MGNREVDIERLRRRKRVTHRVVAAAFFVLFATGLIFFTPALSGLATGGAAAPRRRLILPQQLASSLAFGRSGKERGL